MSDTRGITTIPGIDSFGGVIVKPAQWNRDGDYRGKRIAYIGTGPDAVRLIPELSHVAGHLTVFQPSLLPVPNVPTLRSGLPTLRNTVRAAANVGMDALVAGFAVVGNRLPLAAKAAEWAQYARTYTLPNVDHVSHPIAKITPTGIETTANIHHAADIIVYDTPLPLPVPATAFAEPAVTAEPGMMVAPVTPPNATVAEPEPTAAETPAIAEPGIVVAPVAPSDAPTVEDLESDASETATGPSTDADAVAQPAPGTETEPAGAGRPRPMDTAPEAAAVESEDETVAEPADEVAPDGGVADKPPTPVAPEPTLKKAPAGAKKTPAKKAAPKAAPAKASAKKAAAEKASVQKVVAKNTTSGNRAPTHGSHTPNHPNQTPSHPSQTPAPAKKTPSKKAPQAGNQAAAKKAAPAKKTPTKKSPTKKTGRHD